MDRDIGLRKTQQLSATIAGSLDMCRKTAQMKPNEPTAFCAVKTHMIHSTATRKCVSNATKLDTKRETAKKKILKHVKNVSQLVIVRIGV